MGGMMMGGGNGFAVGKNASPATVDFLKSVPRDKIDGREDAEIVLKLPNNELKFTGRQYVTGFALPIFYFHVTAAYAILRMKCVPVGKRDYLGGI